MRRLLTLTFLLSILVVKAQNVFYNQADAFFEKYVQKNRVDYQAIKDNPQELNALLDQVKSAKLTISSNHDKALLINAYNLFVIKGISDAYPISSPQGIPSFFDKKAYTIGGKKVSLNELEKKVLIPQTQDARLHFALVCAANGCPKIIKKAYRGELLEEQLSKQTQIALDDKEFTRLDVATNSIKLSQIFSWYSKDFLTKHNSLVDFINTYRSEKISKNTKIGYYEYDWSLNDASTFSDGVDQPSSTSNLLEFTPSKLFKKGQYEINVFNNLYSQTESRDVNGNTIPSAARISILSTMVQFTYGISKKAKVNVGLDAIVSAGSIGTASNSGQFQLFDNGNGTEKAISLSGLGPRIKVQPFKKYPFFSVQSSFLFPVTSNLENRGSIGNVFTALNRYTWKNQFFTDLKLTNKLRLFYEFDVNYLIRRNKQEVFFQPNFVDLPMTAFLTYFPTDKLSLFVNGQYISRYGNTALDEVNPNKTFGLLQRILQLGGGVKYQATSNLGFELSYGNFVSGAGFQGIEAGAGEIVNFGIRFIN